MADDAPEQGLYARAAVALDAINQRHPWSHNDHYHRWIVRRLPARRRAALDVGCGLGGLAAVLARSFEDVDAVDADADMARRAAERFAGDPRVTVRHARFDEVGGTYDAITMVAVLHHLDLEPALRHVRELLAPGGRFLVVGLTRPGSRRDFAVDVASALLNPLVGLVKHPRRATEPRTDPFPVADPALTFDETRDAARRVLPGSRMRRRLFFRCTLEWTAPTAP